MNPNLTKTHPFSRSNKPVSASPDASAIGGGFQLSQFGQRRQAEAVLINLFNIYVGQRLGLYRAMAGSRPVTSFELAIWSGADENYIRAWLDQQAAAGILKVERAAHGLPSRHHLPPAHAALLHDETGPTYLTLLGQLLEQVVALPPALAHKWENGSERAAHPAGDSLEVVRKG
jgi:hypothetical protein